MELKIGHTYEDGWGARYEVRGLAKTGPAENGEAVYWTLQGDWFTESGRRVSGYKEPVALWHKGGDRGPYDLEKEVRK